ncbi:MAG TPA: hypothetical protein ENK41_03780 [Rhodobacteraceae bacterium]|nr:hypothetical protein [Paracoccaceae bacterium]
MTADKTTAPDRPGPPHGGGEPIRSILHFAATGGTIISKALATAPNTTLLSEIEPLSTIHLNPKKSPFFPSDIIGDLHYSPRPVPNGIKNRIFTAGLRVLLEHLDATGGRLLVRGHPHSRYCAPETFPDVPLLNDLLGQIAPVLSIVTVRQPISSYISASKKGWLRYQPATYDEYCARYLKFLDDHKDLPVHRYEDFVRSPQSVMEKMCADLQLPMPADFEALIGLFVVSGDSGRKGGKIAPRPAREVPEELVQAVGTSENHKVLCARLGYDGSARELPP